MSKNGRGLGDGHVWAGSEVSPDGRSGPALFVSYRSVNWPSAALLKQALIHRFGTRAVFFDVDTLNGGDLVQDGIMKALESATVMLVVIDKDWSMTIEGRDGHRRPDNPRDWVRVEIRYALGHGLTIIPVQVDETPLPGVGNLPADLAGLADRMARPLRHSSTRDDLARLIDDVEYALQHGNRAN